MDALIQLAPQNPYFYFKAGTFFVLHDVSLKHCSISNKQLLTLLKTYFFLALHFGLRQYHF